MNLPASFIDYTRALLGNEEYEKLAAALQQEPPVSIRINKLRMKEEGVSSLTDSSARFSFNKVPWASDGYYLDERLTFTFDPLFHAGCYYVQEASSMFVEQLHAFEFAMFHVVGERSIGPEANACQSDFVGRTFFGSFAALAA